jgi:WD40 repeat protein
LRLKLGNIRMVGSRKTFRIFVSSTFSDLKAERNALQQNESTFSRLRKLCNERGTHFQDIDLRWGVSEEAAINQQTTNICMGEIERCQIITPRPNFIILLGDRYGWCPPPSQIPAAEFKKILTFIRDPQNREEILEWYIRDENAVPPEYFLRPRIGKMTAYENWRPIEENLQRTLEKAAHQVELSPEALIKYTTSVTEQEIYKGALQTPNAQKHTFAFFRSIKGLPDDRTAKDFIDLNRDGKQDIKNRDKLIDLKNRIQDLLPGNVHQYNTTWTDDGITLGHLDQFCEDVYQCLSKVILDEIKSTVTLIPEEKKLFKITPNEFLDEEGLTHNKFAEERLEFFVGRTQVLGEIKKYLNSLESNVLCVLGKGGTGKSSLLAKAIEQAQNENLKAQVIYRFIGTTPDSSYDYSLLESLCRELARRYEDEMEEIPTGYHELVTHFINRISRVTAEYPLIIFLDALDQITSQKRAGSLAWIPETLPQNLRIIVSTRPGNLHQLLEGRGAQIITLKGLSNNDGNNLLEKWLRAANRTLQESQLNSVLEKFVQSEGNPLFLKIAFEEAYRWESAEGEPPIELADDIPGIIKQNLMARLAQEDNHGQVLVSHALGYLAASRYGLAEDELLDLLSTDTDVYGWFLKSAYHYPQDVLIAAREYQTAHNNLNAREHGEMKHPDEDSAKKWLDKIRKHDKKLNNFLKEVLSKPGGPRLPVVLWSRLFFDLQPYLTYTQAEGSPLLNFFHNELRDVAYELFLSDGMEIHYHKKMADYFHTRSFTGIDRNWDNNYARGLSELPYHLIKGKRWDDVIQILTDFDFLQTKVETLGHQKLIDDYKEARLDGFNTSSLREIQEALELSSHVLIEDSSQLASQLTGRLLLTENEPVLSLLKQIRIRDQPWLRPLRASLLQPGSPLLRTLVGHRAPIKEVSFSSDGQEIISLSADRAMHVWDPESGELLGVISDSQRSENEWQRIEQYDHLDKDPKNRWSVHTDFDIIEVQEKGIDNGKKTFVGHNHKVTTLAFSPDGSKLVTGGNDHTVRIWDLVRDNETTITHEKGMTAAAVAPDGTFGISGHRDGTLLLWDFETGVEKKSLVGHNNRVNAIAITEDGQRVVSASSDSTLRVWDLVSGDGIVTINGHKDKVLSLDMTPDGLRAISASQDNTLKAWDLTSGRELSSMEGPQSWEPVIAISPNGKKAVAAYRDNTLRIWDIDTSVLTATCIGHINTINSVAFSPDGCHIISGGDDQSLRIWDANTGIEKSELLGHWDSVRVLDIPRDNLLVSLSRDDTVRVWDCDLNKEVYRMGGRKADPSGRSRHPSVQRTGVAPNEPAGISTTADGKRALTFYINDDTLRLWDLERGDQIAAFTGDFTLMCCSIANDGSILAGTKNGQVHILRLEGIYAPPDLSAPKIEVEKKVDPIKIKSSWRVEPAGIEKLDMVASGEISAENLESFSAYRLVHPPNEQLVNDGPVTLSGEFNCNCGNKNRFKATIRFGGFFDARSKYLFFCESGEDNIGCNRDMMLVGITTRSERGKTYWLLLEQRTGPPGMIFMPGTASGFPELRIDTVEDFEVETIPLEETGQNEKSISQPQIESAAQKPPELRTELTAGDVLAMAIVYEGSVTDKPNRKEIAQELLANFLEAGILEGISLHPYTAIRIQKADETAYYQGDYEPVDKLPKMLEKGIIELRDRLQAKGQGLGKVATRMVTLKGRSKIVSTCWIAMHILQSSG